MRIMDWFIPNHLRRLMKWGSRAGAHITISTCPNLSCTGYDVMIAARNIQYSSKLLGMTTLTASGSNSDEAAKFMIAKIKNAENVVRERSDGKTESILGVRV